MSAYCTPEQAASTYLGANRNQAFADAGFVIHNFAPTPTRGVSNDVRRTYIKERMEESLFDNHMHVHRFHLMREGRNPLGRALRYSILCVILYIKGIIRRESKEANVMFISSTPPILGSCAAMVKRHTRVPLVYNLQDIFPDSLVNNGLASKGGLLWKIGRVIEDFTYRHADKIIVISEDFKKNIMAKGVLEDKIVVVYNWVDQDAVVDIPREENKLFDKYGLDRSKFYVTYNGNVGLSQNMDMLLDVAEEFLQSEGLECSEGLESLDCKDIHFVIVGEGAYKAEVDRQVKERNLTNVHLLPFQPYEDISHVFSLGDVSLVISKPGTGAASVPSKTWSIMSASRPVLANFDENELKDILEGTIQSSGLKNPQGPCGIFTKAGDKEAFKAAILKLYQNHQLGIEYGQNGRQFILDNLTKEVGTKKYVDVIKDVVEKKV